MPYKDPEKQRAYQRAWIRRRRAEYMQGRECLRCGATEDLEWHHFVTDEKVEHRIWSWTRGRLERELSKCIVLCDPCHNEYHASEKRKHGAGAYRRGCRCAICREYKRESNRRYRTAA